MNVAEWAAVVSVVVAMIATGFAVRTHLEHSGERRDQRAVNAAAIAVILPWFTEDREHQSLPQMSKDCLAAVRAFGTRLDAHLINEEEEIVRVHGEMADIHREVRELRARIEETG